MKNQPFGRRLRHAVDGIAAALRSEASLRTQVVLGLAAALVLAWLRPPAIWVALCVLAAAMVLALELVNTALEQLADRLHPELHPRIRIAKDCAAGAVLIASICAVVIGLLTLAVSFGLLGR